MQKSLAEFISLPESELARIIELGPLLITKDDEPRFIAQSIETFEEMVRRLRQLEAVSRKRAQINAAVIPLRR